MKVASIVAIAAMMVAGCTGVPSDDGITVVEAHATSFIERDVTVSVGDAVLFRMVTASHTVDFSEGDERVNGVSLAHSGNLNPGDEIVVTFTEPGVYEYFCAYHSSVSGGKRIGMIGTVRVA